MRPAIIGSMAESESSAITALSLRMERALSAVGKVSGNRMEKKMMSSSVRMGRP